MYTVEQAVTILRWGFAFGAVWMFILIFGGRWIWTFWKGEWVKWQEWQKRKQ